MRADRHRAQAVGEHEVESGCPRDLNVEMVCRPVAGHLGVAMRHVLVDVLADGSERVGPHVFGEAMVGGLRTQVGDAGQAEQHHGPPLLDGDAPVGVGLFEVHHDMGARPRGPHGGDLRAGIDRLLGEQGPVQHDVVLAVHAAAGALPRGRRKIGPGRLLRVEDKDHGKHGRYGQALEHRESLITGGRGIGGDGLWPEATGKGAVPRRRHRQLAHHATPSAAQKLYIPQLAW